MGEDAKPPIQFVIKTFKWRAFRRQLGAYGFLLLMLAGIGAAAYVFIQAKEITERETTTTDTTTKISALKKSMNDNDLKFKEEYNSRNALFVNMIKELPMKPKEDCKKLVQFGPPEGDWTEIFFT